jgi:hypothetical protein
VATVTATEHDEAVDNLATATEHGNAASGATCDVVATVAATEHDEAVENLATATEHGNAASGATGDAVATVTATEHDEAVENLVNFHAFAGKDFAPHVLPDDMETSTPGGPGSEEPAPISESQPTGVMEGPALPRWIDDASVDSMAMYSAFLSVVNDSLEYKCRQLYIIHHRPGPGICQPFPKRIWCTDVGCRRCAEGFGGYQFRWYHPSWMAAYLRLKRPGAWMPTQLQ